MLTYVLAVGRFLLPVLAIIIISGALVSLFRTRPRKTPFAVLTNMANSDRIVIDSWETAIGRHEKCDIVLNYPTVSRYHAVISRRENGWIVADTYSKTGVYVNEQRINKRAEIFDGDIIVFGSAVFSFSVNEELIETAKPKEEESVEKPKEAENETKPVKKPLPTITNSQTGEVFQLHSGENRVGRDPSSDIYIQVQSVSRNHASMGRVHGEWIVKDNGSRYGTFLNSQPVSKAEFLKDGDVINVGGVELIFNG
ncbi:MAG: FHA domain-containing protein [Clostridiales bacterium]|nr:FHA domain-containing protein [Clostridiales bacterium]